MQLRTLEKHTSCAAHMRDKREGAGKSDERENMQVGILSLYKV